MLQRFGKYGYVCIDGANGEEINRLNKMIDGWIWDSGIPSRRFLKEEPEYKRDLRIEDYPDLL